MQTLRTSSGDKVAVSKWMLPPDGAPVMLFTAEIEPVKRAVGRAAVLEVDAGFLIQHLVSRFVTRRDLDDEAFTVLS